MFPDDATLIARGKHSTLSRERRQQVERFQKAAQAAMHAANAALKEAQEMPPDNPTHLVSLERCIANMQETRQKIVDLCGQLIEIKREAWSD